MTAATSEAERLRLARAAVIGLVGTLLLGVVDPLCGYMATTPWTGGGFDGFVRAIVIAPLFGLFASLPLAIFLRDQRPWYPGYFKLLAGLLLAAWAVLMPLSCLYYLGVVTLHPSADARVFGGVGFIGLALGAIPAAMLVHCLRHPWWAPVGGR